jgi:hypothetical protein
MRATCSPAAGRVRMTAMTWRLAAAFCCSTGREQVEASAHLSSGHHRIGPLPWPRAAWQSPHISTVNRPPTLLKGPAAEPQKEQRSAIILHARTGVRLMLRLLSQVVSRWSTTAPRVASCCTRAPTRLRLSTCGVVMCKLAASGSKCGGRSLHTAEAPPSLAGLPGACSQRRAGSSGAAALTARGHTMHHASQQRVHCDGLGCEASWRPACGGPSMACKGSREVSGVSPRGPSLRCLTLERPDWRRSEWRVRAQ